MEDQGRILTAHKSTLPASALSPCHMMNAPLSTHVCILAFEVCCNMCWYK
jgi:hypothetical protein